MDKEDLKVRFTYHAPRNEEQIEIHEHIREFAHSFAQAINDFCPDGREKSLAITKLEEVVMWANASIARNEK